VSAPGNAARSTARRAARAAWPYAAVLAASLPVSAVTDWRCAPAFAAGGVTASIGRRLHEAHGWHRAGGKAAMRRRRKFQGTAGWREISEKLSPRAARRHAARTCPDLDPSEAPVIIGRAKGRVIADTWTGSRLVYAPPQTLKTGLASCWAADAPGALLAFSSRCDQYSHTYRARAARGPVRVLNADGEGGIPTDFAWSPVDGCADPAVAMRRAGDLIAAAPRDPSGRDAHWDALSKDLLQFLLRAAALDRGADLRAVRFWASSPAAAAGAAEILKHAPAAAGGTGHDDWAARLAGMLLHAREDERYWSAVSQGVTTALAWLDDPVMTAAACPRPGEGIDLRRFIEDGAGTIYMIGADREHGSLAPYFAAFGAEAFHAARSAAEARPGRRLRRPFVIVADEAATIVPLPWDKITAVSSGYGIGITACVQADSQLTARWGEARAATIRTNFTTKIIGPGFTDPGELEALSLVCGETDSWHGSKDHLVRERLYPPERIRLLRDWHALVVHRNARPLEVKVTPVWARPGYDPAPPPAQPPARQPAAVRQRPAPAAVPGSGRPQVASLVPATAEEVPSWQDSRGVPAAR